MNAARATVETLTAEIAKLKASKSGLDAWSHTDARKLDKSNDKINDLEHSLRAAACVRRNWAALLAEEGGGKVKV